MTKKFLSKGQSASGWNSQGGALPILILLAALGILGFLLISNTASFRDQLFNQLFPKPASEAAKPEAPSVPDEILLKFKPGVNQKAKDAVMKRYGITTKDTIPQIDVIVAKVPERAKGKVIQALSHNPFIEYAEPNRILEVQETIPNDPYYLTRQFGLPRIGMPIAWDITKGSSSIVVGVVDTGLFEGHEDLVGKSVPGKSFVSYTESTDDDNAHGTRVSGVIAALTNNGTGVGSLGWNTSVMPLKACNNLGYCSQSDIAEAVVFAVDNGVKVANLIVSGCGELDQGIQDAVNYAWSRGVVTACAAGNDGIYVDYTHTENVIIVGATDGNDNKADHSNFGPGLDVLAPGTGVMTTERNGSYTSQAGTSSSAPHVSALAALIMSAKPSLTNQQVVDIITQTPQDMIDPGWDQYSGWGRINAAAALEVATGTTIVDTTPPDVFLFQVVNGPDNTASGTVNVSYIAKSDNSGEVIYGEVYLDDNLISRDCLPPFSTSLDTTTLTNSTHNISVKIYDRANNVGTASATFTANNTTSTASTTPTIVSCPAPTPYPTPAADTTNPTVSLTSPTSDTTVSGPIDITASATDDTTRDNEGVTKVEFYTDGTLFTTDYTPSYLTSWDTTVVSNGSHILSTKAYDAAGNVGTSSSVTVTVNNPVPDTTAPTTSITSPTDGTTVSGSFNVTGSSSDNVGVTSVTLKLDGVWCGESTTNLTNFQISCDSTVVPNGTHTLKALAYDGALNPGESSLITVTINNPVPTPTPTSTPTPTPSLTPTPIATSTPSSQTVIISSISSTTQPNSATVKWTTNIPSTSRVEYGLTTSLGTSTTEDTNLTTNHSVTIIGLTKQTRYYYKVISKNSAGLETSSGVQQFRTKNR